MQSNEQSSKRKVSVSSGLAFAFMPQFKYCFAGLKELAPLFGLTLAIILSNAKLISKDHPILNNQRGYGIGDLMGEAWYTLRTTQATTAQWGVFSSIVMFAALFISAIGTFVLRVGLGVGAVAHAQLFQAPGTPYNSGTDSTMTAMSSAVGTPTGMFDERVPKASDLSGTVTASKDYALLLLDKVLRQSASSPQSGGTLQNALASLMQVYNSGVLVVASVMIFWMIMSVVVDTAKTGIIGGNRHNMVWAPIRVVFALGIMIPLGSQGFSSGQYMVMKLAEWGSNFGSQGWSSYVTKVIAGNNNDSLLMGYQATNVTSLVSEISQTMVCGIAYNAYSTQAGTTDADQLVKMDPSPVAGVVTGKQYLTYTTASSDNMCGQIAYEKTNSTTASYQYPYDSSVASVSASGTGYSGLAASSATQLLGSPQFMTALNTFTESMTDAITSVMADGTGSVFTSAQKFACTFVARRFSDGGSGTNPVSSIAPCSSVGIDNCGGNHDPATGKDPDDSCQASMASDITTAMKSKYDTAAATLSGALGTALLTETQQRGWASMGMWFAEIAAVNVQLQKALQPKVEVTPGVAWNAGDGVTCGLTGRIWHGFWNWTGLSSTKCVTDLQKQVGTVMEDYGRWWDYASTNHASPPSPSAQDGTNIAPAASASWTSVGRQMLGGSGNDEDTTALANAIAGKFTPAAVNNPFYVQPLSGSEKGSYPLAQLSNIGSSLIKIGVTIDVLSTVGQALTGAIPVVGTGLANLFMWGTLTTIGNALITGGLVLLFWLPVMPALRVGFAALTWITAVFIAVAMVPIAALAHLTSEGDGLSGGARVAWVLWLNILLRPILVVLGFVGAMLVYNSFAVYFNSMFGGVASMVTIGGGLYSLLGYFAFSAIYVLTLYTAANACFKMLDLLPDGMMTWMGSTGAAHAFDDHHGGIASAMGGQAVSIGAGIAGAAGAGGAMAGGAATKTIGAGGRLAARGAKAGWNKLRGNGGGAGDGG